MTSSDIYVSHLASCESTQLVARELLQSRSEAIVLVIADEQTGGRGREQRQWFHHPGALAMSAAIRGPLEIPAEPLTVLAAREVAQVLCRHAKCSSAKIEVRHPNDLLHNGRKLGGLLIDSRSRGDVFEYVICGIGLNLEGPPFVVPNDRREATTLQAVAGDFSETWRVDRLALGREISEQIHMLLTRQKQTGS